MRNPSGKSSGSGGGRLVSLYFSDLSQISTEPGTEGYRCFALIGQGSKFCVRGSCTFSTHATGEKFVPADRTLYILNNSAEGFCEPALSTSHVTSDQLTTMLGDSKTKADWLTEFGIIEAQDSPMGTDGVAQRLDYYEKAQAMRTPHKRKLTDTEDLLSNFAPLAKRTFTETFMSEESFPKEFVDRYRIVDDTVVEMSSLLPTVVGSVTNRIAEQEDMTDKVNLRLVNAESMLGKPNHEVNGEFAPTVWGTVSILNDAVGDVNQRLTAMASSWTGSQVDLQEFRRLQMDHEKLVEFQRDEMIPAVKSLLQEQKTTRMQLAGLLSRVGSLEGSSSGHSSSGSAASLFGSTGGAGLGGASGSATIDAKIAGLETALVTLKAQLTPDGVSFGGLGWRSVAEGMAWCSVKLPNNAFGCFADVFLLLEQVRTKHNGTETSTLATLEKLRKLDLTAAEATHLTSFSNLIPGILGRGSGSTNTTKTHLPALEKFADFDMGDNMSGLRYVIEAQRPDIKTAQEELIEDRLGNCDEAALVARAALASSDAFLQMLLTFMDETYKRLLRAGFEEARSWALVTKLVYRIFADMNKVRGGLKTGVQLSDPKALSAGVLYATMRTIDIQSEYMKYSIADHPSISSEYVKFLAMNSGLQKVTKLERDVTALQSVLKSVKTTLESVQKTANTAANKANEAKEAIGKLPKKS